MLAATGGFVYLHPISAMAERAEPNPSAGIGFTAVYRFQRALAGESDAARGYSEKSGENGITRCFQRHDSLGNSRGRFIEYHPAAISRGYTLGPTA